MNTESSHCNVRLNTKYVLGAVGSGALSKVINNSIMLKGTSQRKMSSGLTEQKDELASKWSLLGYIRQESCLKSQPPTMKTEC